MSVDISESQLELVRVLWRMRAASEKVITAAIYLVETGLELRVDYSGDVRRTELSRKGEHPLLTKAEALRMMLLKQGWTETLPDDPIAH